MLSEPGRDPEGTLGMIGGPKKSINPIDTHFLVGFYWVYGILTFFFGGINLHLKFNNSSALKSYQTTIGCRIVLLNFGSSKTPWKLACRKNHGPNPRWFTT